MVECEDCNKMVSLVVLAVIDIQEFNTFSL